MNVLKLKNVVLGNLLFLLTIAHPLWEGVYAQHSGTSCVECCVIYRDNLSKCADDQFFCTSTVDNIVRFGVNSQLCTITTNPTTELLCRIVADSGASEARSYCSKTSRLCTSAAISRSQTCINNCRDGQQSN